LGAARYLTAARNFAKILRTSDSITLRF